jgi:thiamine biosynthesis lipoprotein
MKFRILVLIIALFSISCTPQPTQEVYKQQFYVFGTLVGLSIWGMPQPQAADIANQIAADLQSMHNRWHAWHPSPLVNINQAIAQGQPAKVEDNSLLELIKLSKQFYEQSDSLFNPAIGHLIELWGFQQDELPAGAPPTAAQLQPLLAQKPSMDDVSIMDNVVSCKNPAVHFDFGGVAKGYAVDLVMEKLKQLGVQNAIINAGGNLKAMGRKGKEAWQIGIRQPKGEGVLAALSISGEESVMTSGDYERYREYQGQHYSHILDPRTGTPAQQFASVTVIHPNGALADVASTALTIAGLEGWYKIAQQMGLKQVMLVDQEGTVYLSPEMAERVQFQPRKEPKVKLTLPL